MGTLLIVEDDITTREALIELLDQDGREIVTASDGQQALECLMSIPRPSLILLDLYDAANEWLRVSAVPVHQSDDRRHSHDGYVWVGLGAASRGETANEETSKREQIESSG